MVGTGDTGFAVVDVDARQQVPLVHVSLSGPGSIEGYQLPVISVEVELGRGKALDSNAAGAVVVDGRPSGDDVTVFKDGVGKSHAKRQAGLLQGDFQGGAGVLVPVGLRQSAEGSGLSGKDPVAFHNEVEGLHTP